MTANEVKPGTRCMARDSVYGYATGPLPLPSCGSRAVRMVYVCTWDENPRLTDPAGPKTVQPIPMCAACAEFHERDKAERETASAIHAIHGMPGEPEPEVGR